MVYLLDQMICHRHISFCYLYTQQTIH